MKYKLKKGIKPFRFWAGRDHSPEIYFIQEEGELPKEIFEKVGNRISEVKKVVKEIEHGK